MRSLSPHLRKSCSDDFVASRKIPSLGEMIRVRGGRKLAFVNAFRVKNLENFLDKIVEL